jgi:integrase
LTEHPRPPFFRPPEISAFLESAIRHDDDSFAMTREEKIAGILGCPGRTRRHRPIGPMLLFSLLAGTRLNDAISLRWEHVFLDALEGAGEVVIPASISKTRRERSIALDVSQSLRVMLAAMKLKSGGKESVFDLTKDDAQNAMKRLIKKYGAPKGVTWKSTRSTCGTYLSNAPGIYGAASTFYSVRRLGHSVTVAKKHYLGLVRVSAEAKTPRMLWTSRSSSEWL